MLDVATEMSGRVALAAAVAAAAAAAAAACSTHGHIFLASPPLVIRTWISPLLLPLQKKENLSFLSRILGKQTSRKRLLSRVCGRGGSL